MMPTARRLFQVFTIVFILAIFAAPMAVQARKPIERPKADLVTIKVIFTEAQINDLIQDVAQRFGVDLQAVSVDLLPGGFHLRYKTGITIPLVGDTLIFKYRLVNEGGVYKIVYDGVVYGWNALSAALDAAAIAQLDRFANAVTAAVMNAPLARYPRLNRPHLGYEMASIEITDTEIIFSLTITSG